MIKCNKKAIYSQNDFKQYTKKKDNLKGITKGKNFRGLKRALILSSIF